MPKFELGLPFLNTNIEDFKKVVFTVSQLINDGTSNILFGIEKDIQIEIDDSALVKYEIDKKLLNKVINLEFIPLLEAILEETDQDFIDVQIRQFANNLKVKNSDSKKFEYEAKLQEKIDYIKEAIINDKMVNRYIVKSTTKHPKIKNIAWEINRKIYDKKKSEVNAKYATINIKMSKELDGTNDIIKMFSFMQPEIKIKEFIFDCDENDIDYLIKFLESVKTKLINCE